MKTVACLLGIASLPLASCAGGKNPTVPKASLADVKWGRPVNDPSFDKNALAGKVVVVEEWGIYCPACLASLPKMARLVKSEASKGLAVVGLECQDGTKENILKILKSTGVKYTVQSGGSAPGNTEGVLPYACVFDVTGKLVYNGDPADAGFEKAVRKSLKEAKAR